MTTSSFTWKMAQRLQCGNKKYIKGKGDKLMMQIDFLNKTEKDFENYLTELLQKAVDRADKAKMIKKVRDIKKLYASNIVGGYYEIKYAVICLRQTYTILDIPLDKETSLKFKYCLEYAENKLNGYSVFPWGNKNRLYSMPIIFPKSWR